MLTKNYLAVLSNVLMLAVLVTLIGLMLMITGCSLARTIPEVTVKGFFGTVEYEITDFKSWNERSRLGAIEKIKEVCDNKNYIILESFTNDRTVESTTIDPKMTNFQVDYILPFMQITFTCED